MENLTSLENLTDDLKKQLWDLTKNVIPALEQKISSGGSGDTSALEAEVAALNEKVTLLVETTIPQLETRISNAENTEIESELSQLSTQVSNLTNSEIPALEERITAAENDGVEAEITLIKSELSTLTNTTIPSMQAEISEAQNDEIESELNSLKADLSTLSDTKIPDLEQQIAAAENTELEAKLLTLESELANITDVVIPELESKIGSNSGGSGTGGGEEWITVYDMNSEDETLNWGYTAGMTAAKGLISTSADFTPYKYMRLWYVSATTYVQYHDFYIESAVSVTTTGTQYRSLVRMDTALNALVCHSFGFKYDTETGKHLLYVGTGRLWNLKNSGYPTLSGLSNNTAYFISKIEVKS